MQSQLLVTSGPDQGRTFSLTEGQPLVLGRGESATARLSDPHVSRSYCRLVTDEGKFFLHDPGSSGGTFVNGQQITQRELKPGDVNRKMGGGPRFFRFLGSFRRHFAHCFMEALDRRADSGIDA